MLYPKDDIKKDEVICEQPLMIHTQTEMLYFHFNRNFVTDVINEQLLPYLKHNCYYVQYLIVQLGPRLKPKD